MKVFRKLLRNFSHESTNDEQRSSRDLHNTSRNTVEHQSQEEENFESSDFCVKSSKLHLAVLSEREVEVKKYATKRNVNEQDTLKRTALHLAVMQNNINIVGILLSHGASAEIYDRGGFTPFLRAVEIGNIDLVKIFWDYKLDKSQTDFNGNTALHLAVTYGFYKIVDLLVQNSTLVNRPNDAGDYPLHTATQNESFSIAKTLLKNHALVDVEDKMKRTPLMIAVKIGNLSLVELFLSFKANPDQRDVNGISVKEYALSCKNSNIRILLIGNQAETNLKVETKLQINDEDSQLSELSCTLPPILEAPRSWKILHPNDRTPENKKMNRRNVKSLSPDFPEKSVLNKSCYADRRKSFSSFSLTDGNSEFVKLPIFSTKDENSQYKSCQKALDELSLHKLHEPEKSNQKYDQKRHFKLNMFSKSDRVSNDISILNGPSARESIQSECDKKRKMLSKKYDDDFSDSSDEDPPFWKNSLDGGYFTGDPSCDSRKKSTTAEYNSSTSEENTDDESGKNVSNPMLNRLKEITQENLELETETAVLREAAEKLKYDLANYRLMDHVKETNLTEMKTQMTALDSKYLKAIQKINSFQLCMNNMQQEIRYLRKSYEKKRKPGGIEFEPKIQADEENVHKLKADVLYWKTKYEEIANQTGENHLANFNLQNLVSLNVELNRLKGKVEDCLSRADYAELQNQHEIVAGKMMQHVLEEANCKLQASIAEIKCDIESRLHNGDKLPNNTGLRETENINMKQKLLLEIARLSALLKEKECHEQHLKNQLSDLRDEIEKLIAEKRKSLVSKKNC